MLLLSVPSSLKSIWVLKPSSRMNSEMFGSIIEKYRLHKLTLLWSEEFPPPVVTPISPVRKNSLSPISSMVLSEFLFSRMSSAVLMSLYLLITYFPSPAN